MHTNIKSFSDHVAELRKHPQVAWGLASFECGLHQEFPRSSAVHGRDCDEML